MDRDQFPAQDASKQLRSRDQEDVYGSMAELAHIVRKEKKEQMRLSSDPLFRACQKVGAFLFLSFRQPKQDLRGMFLSKRLDEICRYSGVRYRKVKLKGNWHKRSFGAMLCFFGHKRVPVAVTQEGEKSFFFHPFFKKRIEVDDEHVDDFKDFAYQFYPSLQDNNSGIKKTFLRHFKLRQAVGIFFLGCLFSSLLLLAYPFSQMRLFDDLLAHPESFYYQQIMLLLLLALVTKAFLNSFLSYIMGHLLTRALFFVQTTFWDRFFRAKKISNRGDSYFQKVQAPLMITEKTSAFCGEGFLQFCAFFTYFALLFYLSKVVTAYIFLAFVLWAGPLAFIYKCIFLRKKALKEKQDNEDRFLYNIFSSLDLFRSYALEKRVFSRWAQLYAQKKRKEISQDKLKYISNIFQELLPFWMCFAFFAAFFINPSLGSSQMSLGGFFAYLTTVLFLSFSLKKLSKHLFYFLDALEDGIQGTKQLFNGSFQTHRQHLSSIDFQGKLSLDMLSYTYPNSSDMILKDLCMEVDSGESIALIGGSGSGKSTLLKLLTGFLKPLKGAVYYDLNDFSLLDQQELRRAMGIVGENSQIVDGSLYDNVTMGRFFDADFMGKTLEICGFNTLLSSFPKGMNTRIIAASNSLSQGEKQRLLLARALLMQPKILFLDDALCFLDRWSQKEIIKNLLTLNTTLVFFSQSSYIESFVDTVYDLEGGDLKKRGVFKDRGRKIHL